MFRDTDMPMVVVLVFLFVLIKGIYPPENKALHLFYQRNKLHRNEVYSGVFLLN